MFDETSGDRFLSASDDGEYLCPSCGEQIVVPVDRSVGANQRYVEDCPVCCRPNRLTVQWHPTDGVIIMSEPE